MPLPPPVMITDLLVSLNIVLLFFAISLNAVVGVVTNNFFQFPPSGGVRLDCAVAGRGFVAMLTE
jgi:hypothetical protein